MSKQTPELSRAQRGSNATINTHEVLKVAARHNCQQHKVENVFFGLILLLFSAPDLMPRGSIIDAGAHDGIESCHYAAVAPERIIHAIDPLSLNIEVISRMARRFHNIRPTLGGLGRHAAVLHVPKHKSRYGGQQISIASTNGVIPRDTLGVFNIMQGNLSTAHGQPFPVKRLDDQFAVDWPEETLGFAHFDVEGNELDVLIGGESIIRRDLPIFTVELVVHKDANYTTSLLDFMSHHLEYDVLLVEEECGLPLDCRNLMAIPRRRANLLAAILTRLDAFSRNGTITLVNSSTIVNFAYPCCRSHAACCTNARSCCTPSTVSAAYRLPKERRWLH